MQTRYFISYVVSNADTGNIRFGNATVAVPRPFQEQSDLDQLAEYLQKTIGEQMATAVNVAILFWREYEQPGPARRIEVPVRGLGAHRQ